MIPIKSKTTEEVIKAYLKNMYSIFGGSKYILSDKGGNLPVKIAWLAEELGFIKLLTPPYIPTDNSVIECTHSFLKVSNKKLICNQNTDWNELAHLAMMAYNVFANSAAGEAPFYLMFG